MFTVSGIILELFSHAQLSKNQIYEQKQAKRNQRIYVDEQDRTCQTGECVPHHGIPDWKRYAVSNGNQTQDSPGIGITTGRQT